MEMRQANRWQRDARSTSPIEQPASDMKTFIFSELPPEEKNRFMDFLIQNQVYLGMGFVGGEIGDLMVLNQIMVIILLIQIIIQMVLIVDLVIMLWEEMVNMDKSLLGIMCYG